MSISLSSLYASYKRFVSENPQSISDYETTVKLISYLIAGRIHNSQVVTQLVYSLSNLLVLFNDRIILTTQQVDQPNTASRLKLWLTVLEYSEVFVELSATKLWGIKGKWFIIACMQIFKCVSRIVLIYHHKERVMHHPPVPPLDRKNIRGSGSDVYECDQEAPSIAFTLKRSGRTIRTIESSPPMAFRTWKPLEWNPAAGDNENISKQAVVNKQMLAETCFVIKPLAHLGCMACFGRKAWKPWLLALLLDYYSIHLYRSCIDKKYLTKQESLQISQRKIFLLLYLLRSPFYDSVTKNRIQRFLMALSLRVPLAHHICKPLALYLTFWQSTYAYMWSM